MHSRHLTGARLQELGNIVGRLQACTELARRLTRQMTWNEQQTLDDKLQQLANDTAQLCDDITVEGLRQWNDLAPSERAKKKAAVR